jgi:K+ transporter
MVQFIMMLHVLFGMLFIIGAVWLYVDVLNASEANKDRIKRLSFAVAIFMWLAYLIGGYWYVIYYNAEKAVILKGPWAFSHSFFMEVKEHVILMLVLLATFIPMIASHNLSVNRAARKAMLWTTGLAILIGMAMDGAGAIIGVGVKMGLLK